MYLYFSNAIFFIFFIEAQQDDLAEKKRKEYEEWLRTQEMEAYRLEYDCSVKYEEHQSEDKHEEQINKQAAKLASSSSRKTSIYFLI